MVDKWDAHELQRVCLERGLPYDADVEVMRAALQDAAVFARTPVAVARYMASFAQGRCADVMAGNGNITRFLPAGTLAVELVQCRSDAGTQRAPLATWLCADMFSELFIRTCVRRERFDTIFSNPAFEFAIPALYVASLMLRAGNPAARLVFLLPTDFFEGSLKRRRLYRLLNLSIESEHKVGRWCYYPERPRAPQKLTCDSVFIFRLGRDSKFEHRLVQARVKGLQMVL
jgi:hypothetical protein